MVWAVLLSESSHVFCCVFPTIFSLIGLLAGAGMVVMPVSLIHAHEYLHQWELPMIVASGLILGLGWLTVWYSGRIDCHSTGCHHGACAPRKSRAHKVLYVATILFCINVFVYAAIHKSTWFAERIAAEAHKSQSHSE